MPAKKKNNKKADDWESELGEAPATAAVSEANETPEADAEEEFPAGGLMAMMRKKQKKKKGKQGEDFLEGDDPPAEEETDLAEKAPVEASIDDEFAPLPDKKGKGKGVAPKVEDDDDERGADGKVLTKAQKEKLKKEREKQRKKENVSLLLCHSAANIC